MNGLRIDAPYSPFIHQDNRDSTKYVVDLRQGGLGLPDRDYYLDDTFKDVRAQYVTHVAKMLGMAGERDADDAAQKIVALETELAKAQWTRVENRDPVKTYNKVEIAQLARSRPASTGNAGSADAGVVPAVDYVIVAQPSYMTGLRSCCADTPLPVWKSYFKWRCSTTPHRISRRLTSTSGSPSRTPCCAAFRRTGRAGSARVEFVDTSIGEALGKLYVARYFPPENKARMEALVANLLAAYRQSIDELDWMSRETKAAGAGEARQVHAQDRLPEQVARLLEPRRRHGRPASATWMRAQAFEYQRNIAKLGKPIDRNEWGMTPQTVNAYYNRERNEIVFPAAILQPPFFDVAADDAVNYGGIGAVIGHEISHGFDDGGSRFDGDGNLHRLVDAGGSASASGRRRRRWSRSTTSTSPLPGFHVNGELTLGENIADNSGLAIAYRAYKISLGGKPAPVIDGLTGDQRFYYGWAQVWRGKSRTQEAIRLLKVDPHSPQAVRGTATLRNQVGFYEAFGVKEGDRMYMPPEERVSLW